MNGTPIGNTIVRPREHSFERVTTTQLLLWILLGYVAWLTFAVVFESVERHRWQVRPQEQIDAISNDAEREHAAANNHRHVSAMTNSVPYMAFDILALVVGILAGIQTGRWSVPALLRRSGKSRITRHLAFEYGLLPAGLAMCLVTTPAVMAFKIWENFPAVRY